MKSLIALLLLPAVVPAQQLDVHADRQQVTVAPNTSPQEYTVDCAAGQRALSGGYSHAARQLRVTASYPAASGTGWIVRVLNPAPQAQPLEVSVLCSEVKSSVVSSTEASADCPDETVVSGGGYLSEGQAAVTGSYPAAEGWAIDAVPPVPSQVTVYAVCVTGLRPSGSDAEVLHVTAGKPVCDGEVVEGANCAWPRRGEGSVKCEDTLIGGGYQVVSGTLPGFSVVNDFGSEDAWNLGVDGYSVDNKPLSVRLFQICAIFPTTAQSAESSNLTNVAVEPDPAIPFYLGGLLIVLLLILLALGYGQWRRRKLMPQGDTDSTDGPTTPSA